MLGIPPETHDFIEFLKSHEPRALFDLFDREDMIRYLERDRDPGFWHELLLHTNWDTPAPYWAAEWMLEQDDCENAVAVLILHMLSGDSFMDGSPVRKHEEEAANLVQKIIARDQADGFPSARLSDSDQFSRDQLLERCRKAQNKAQEAGATDALPIPLTTLITKPTGPRPKTSYLIDECSVAEWVPKTQLHS